MRLSRKSFLFLDKCKLFHAKSFYVFNTLCIFSSIFYAMNLHENDEFKIACSTCLVDLCIIFAEGMDRAQGPGRPDILLQPHHQTVQLGKTGWPEVKGRGQSSTQKSLLVRAVPVEIILEGWNTNLLFFPRLFSKHCTFLIGDRFKIILLWVRD